MMLLSILFFINMPFFFNVFLGNNCGRSGFLSETKLSVKERESAPSGSDEDDEGGSVRSICIVLYT